MRPPALKARTPRANQKLVDAWNHVHGVGAWVNVTKDDGAILVTQATSAAFMLGGHTATIFVDGISGCYALERVRAATS